MSLLPRFCAYCSVSFSKLAAFALMVVAIGTMSTHLRGDTPVAGSEVTNLVDIRFVPGANTLLPAASEGIVTQPLVNGKAAFSSVSKLPQSEYYVGYTITFEGPDIQFSSSPFQPVEGVRARVVCTAFEGFIELEDGKFSPIINVSEGLADVERLSEWQHISLLQRQGGRWPAGSIYFRWRQVDAAGKDISPSVTLHELPAKVAASE